MKKLTLENTERCIEIHDEIHRFVAECAREKEGTDLVRRFNATKNLVVVEFQYPDCTEWGISTGGPNPTGDQFFPMEKDVAFRLVSYFDAILQENPSKHSLSVPCMENFRENYPYKNVKRIRKFGLEEFEINDSVPPTVQNKLVEFQHVFCALEDAKRALADKCRKGHNLQVKKLRYSDVQGILDLVQDFLYSHSA